MASSGSIEIGGTQVAIALFALSVAALRFYHDSKNSKKSNERTYSYDRSDYLPNTNAKAANTDGVFPPIGTPPSPAPSLGASVKREKPKTFLQVSFGLGGYSGGVVSCGVMH